MPPAVTNRAYSPLHSEMMTPMAKMEAKSASPTSMFELVSTCSEPCNTGSASATADAELVWNQSAHDSSSSEPTVTATVMPARRLCEVSLRMMVIHRGARSAAPTQPNASSHEALYMPFMIEGKADSSISVETSAYSEAADGTQFRSR
eukprot:scaffold10060_cov30-Tisochrysis_lutea.AAC.2